ncbi:hypothetical protein BDV93DRAFT_510099 [Ceratobasidium sp. AG-I]|nr:hypothetical protein BDV93DRAFT_510099 [Ceratobasidium sp. AG-I]
MAVCASGGGESVDVDENSVTLGRALVPQARSKPHYSSLQRVIHESPRPDKTPYGQYLADRSQRHHRLISYRGYIFGDSKYAVHKSGDSWSAALSWSCTPGFFMNKMSTLSTLKAIVIREPL